MLREIGSILQPRGSFEPDDSWHYVGEAGKPAFENSLVAYNSDGVKFLKDAAGTVHIQGRAKSGTPSSDIFTLPKGYRPEFDLHFATETSAAIGEIHVHPDGHVHHNAGATGDFSLCISFFVG